MAFMAGLAGFSSAVASLRTASDQGFQVSGEGVQVLLDAVNDLSTDLEDMRPDLQILGQDWPLGTSPTALLYRPHFAATATDPEQGAIAAVMKLREDLKVIRESLEKSRVVYSEADDGGAQGARQAGSPLS